MADMEPLQHGSSVESMCIAGSKLFTASNDSTVKEWEIDSKTGEAKVAKTFGEPGSGDGVAAVCVNPDAPIAHVFTRASSALEVKEYSTEVTCPTEKYRQIEPEPLFFEGRHRVQ